MKKILIVEDDENNMELFTIYIESAGYEVFAAENGKIGIEKIINIKPDLVLMDIRMPVMDGFEAMQYLKANNLIGGTPIICISAFGSNSDIQKMQDAGFTDYLIKPFERHELIAKLKHFISL